MKKIFTKSNIIAILIIVLATSLRIYHLPSRTNFNADQEWLATRAQAIINGDLALLGPITSVGGFSIGPYFIYLWAFIAVLLNGHPISGAILSIVCGIATLVLYFLFIKKYINEKIAIIVTFLMAISVNYIVWDQNPWAPSIFFVAQIMLLYGALISKKDLNGYLYMALGFVLGFSSHFGIILSVLSVLIYLLFVKPIRINLKYFVFVCLILLGGFLPNIVFDITHNFVNFKRMVGIVNGDGLDYFVSFNKVITVLVHNTVDLVYPRNLGLADSVIRKIIFALVIVNGARNVRIKRYKEISILALITLIIPAAFFYIQQGKFSEYYLLMTIPSSVILIALFINDLQNKFKFSILIILIFALITNYKFYKNIKVLWNLDAKEKVAHEIIEKGGYDGYGISLTTKYGEQFGFRYILDNNHIKASLPPKKGETKIFSIIIPEGHDGMYGMEDIDGIGLRWSGI